MKKSKKIINFIDLCGHEKYLKTTISGMMSNYFYIRLFTRLCNDYRRFQFRIDWNGQGTYHDHLGS